jgi:hypothetical protein
MDPFSYLNIATAIAQFLDFGIGIVKTAHGIYKGKSTLKDISKLEEDVSTFQALCANIPRPNDGRTSSETEKSYALTEVLERCERVSSEIATVLAKFQTGTKPNKLQSLTVAIKIQTKSSELERCERLLLATKVDLCTHVLGALGRCLPLSSSISTCQGS